jgi:hypothetical protein
VARVPSLGGSELVDSNLPTLEIDLMAADEDEATEWLRGRAPKKVKVDRPGHVEFERRGTLTGAGIYLKRVMGF